MSEIISICYKPETLRDSNAFSRKPVTTAELIVGYGMEGDIRGGHPRRQLNLMDETRVDELHAQGYKTDVGQLGEHLVISQIDIESLQKGDRLRLGDTVIEVTGRRTGCDRFKAIQQTERDHVALGVMAKVIEGGVIAVGDSVVQLPASQQIET